MDSGSVERRVEFALAVAGLTVAELLRTYGRGKNAFAEWRDRGRKMPEDFLREVIDACAAAGVEVDGHWLLTGAGELQRAPDSEAQVRLRLVREALDGPLPAGDTGAARGGGKPVPRAPKGRGAASG